jgi:predicted Zn-dependent peptidase
VFVVPKGGFQKKHAILAVNYGSNDRRFLLDGGWTDTPQGVAHFLEHQMFSMEDGDAMTRLSANGASPNAYTSTETTAYFFDCIDMFDENLELLLKFVSTPYFTRENIAKEQGIITQEIRMYEDDPDNNLYYGLMRSLFGHSPLRDNVAGTVESVSSITSDILHCCHKAFYAPSNMVLCVVGDVDPERVRSIAEKNTPQVRDTVSRRDYGPPEGTAPAATRFEAAMDVSLPIFLAGCKSAPIGKGPESLRTGLVGILALDLLAGHSSPLYLRLYADGHVNTDFSASFDFEAETAYTVFGGEAREPGYVLSETIKEIERLLAHGPDPALFARIKKAIIGSRIRLVNSFPALANGIFKSHFMGYEPFAALEVLESIDESDVTAFIRDRLVPGDMAISIIKPSDRMTEQ